MQSPDRDRAIDLQAFIANPSTLADESIEIQLAIANHPETPRPLLEILANSDRSEVSQAARLHVNWESEEARGDWQAEIDRILQEIDLGQNDRLALELLRIAPVPPAFFSPWVPSEKLLPGLHNPHLSDRWRQQWLERLARESTLEPRLQLAESADTPIAILEILAGDLELPVRLATQFNRNCTPELITWVEEQHAIAANWQSAPEQLERLGQSRWPWIRWAVARNPSASVETLARLAGDRLFEIQLAAIENPATPAAILARFVDDERAAIQTAIVNYSCGDVD